MPSRIDRLHFLSTLGGGLIACLAWGPPAAWAQPQPGKVQPDQLTFGAVAVGATVEGSVRLFVGGDDVKGLRVDVTPPPFVRLRSTRLGTQSNGNLGYFIFCDVAVSIDTAKAEPLQGEMLIRVGDQSVEVPVQADVKPASPLSTRVLVLGTPFSRFSTSTSDDFKPWLSVVESANLAMHYHDIEEGLEVARNRDLADIDVILLTAEALVRAQDQDFNELDAFLEAGGRIVIATAHFMLGSVEKANHLLATYGLEMSDTEAGGQGHMVVDNTVLADDPLTTDIRHLIFRRPSPIKVDGRKNARVLVQAGPDSVDALAAIAPAGKGEVIVLTSPIWWNWMTEVPGIESDNSTFFARLLTKPRQLPDAQP